MGLSVPHSGTTASRSRRRWAVGAAITVAIALRVLHVVATRDMPLTVHLVGDAAGYYQWASRIAGGEWLGHESFYQAPLYPYILAVAFKGFGVSVWSIRILQSLWIGLAVWCLYLGAARLFNRRCGLVAAWMLALYAPSVFFDGIVQKASLGCLLLCILLALMARVAKPRAHAAILAIGVMTGLLVLTRENALVWLPIHGAWVWFARASASGRSRCLSLGVYALGLGLVLIPVGVRNAYVGRQWSVSTFQAGPNFYIGNHQGATGRYRPLVRGHETPTFERHDATMLAERDVGRALSPKEVSRYWLSRGMDEIRAAPGAWLVLMGRKLLMALNRHEVADAESQYVYADFSSVLRGLGALWHFGVLCPLAAIGIVLTRGRWRELWIYYALLASMVSAVALFYVMARYRYPLVPLLMPFAAVGCVKAWTCIRAREFRRLGLALTLGAIVAIVVNVPIHDEKRLNAHAWMNVGVALAEGGDLAGATIYFRRAVTGDSASAEANNNLAQALAMQEDFAGAIPHYEATLRADPTLMGVNFNLAVALESVGRATEALAHYERAVKLDSTDTEARAATERLRHSGR